VTAVSTAYLDYGDRQHPERPVRILHPDIGSRLIIRGNVFHSIQQEVMIIESTVSIEREGVWFSPAGDYNEAGIFPDSDGHGFGKTQTR